MRGGGGGGGGVSPKREALGGLFPLDWQLFPFDECTFKFFLLSLSLSVSLSLSLSLSFHISGVGWGGAVPGVPPPESAPAVHSQS